MTTLPDDQGVREERVEVPSDEVPQRYQHYRHLYRLNGTWKLHLIWDVVQPNSIVLVSISESTGVGGGRFIGQARFSVWNVSATRGDITVWIDVGWHEPLYTSLDYYVINPSIPE